MTAVVAIVGRPNVGKSTLFNRLAGKRLAIVDDTPGVTRDRREADASLGDLRFRLVDTAGFEDAAGRGRTTAAESGRGQDGDLSSRIQAQTARAMADADVILFLIDARTGLMPLDRELAGLLRRSSVPVVLIANKCEGRLAEAGLAEGHGLGLGQPIPLSAEHGEGLALLYEALQPHVDRHAGASPGADAERPESEAAIARTSAGSPGEPPRETEAARPAAPLQLAVTGRPNVGKSTLINRLIGDERLVTGPEAGITRDAIAIDWRFRDRTIRLFDTAGLRRRAKVDGRLEQLAGADSLRAIRFAHVVVIVIDATSGIERQDLTIADLVVAEGRAPLIAANKWDLVSDHKRGLEAIAERLEQSLPQVRGIPVVPLSALTGAGLDRLLPTALRAYDAWNREVPTGRLNRWLGEMTARQPPPAPHGRPLRIRYMTQTKARPPTFVLFANRPEEVPESYLRYLAGGLREAFGLGGTPLRLSFRRSRNPYAP